MSEKWSKTKADFYKKVAAFASIWLSVLLVVLKTFAAFLTGSLSILSSLVDSLSDVFASLVTFIAIRFSLRPADCYFRYGYMKAESVSALLQAAFIAGSGIFVLYSAFDRFLHPANIEKTNIGIIVMMIGLLLTIFLILFQRYVSKHTDSLAIKADSAHYVVDILTNASIIFSLLVVRYFKLYFVDTLTACLISVYLLYYAYLLALEALQTLMDHELTDNVKQKVIDLIKNTSGIKGFHDFRSRNLGGSFYFEIHIELDGRISLLKAHQITEDLEKKIKQLYPTSQILIHQDPFGIKEERIDDILDGKCKV